MAEPNEREYADLIALELSGIYNLDVSGNDVLGALSAVGLKLVRDDEGDAFLAYEEDLDRDA
jgi:hypothetical protein